MATVHIALDRQRIKDFCRKWKITRMALFGSVLRDDFRPDSDVDVLVKYASDVDWPCYDYFAMRDDIEALFARPVDIVEEGTIRNPIKRRCIYENLETVYESGR